MQKLLFRKTFLVVQIICSDGWTQGYSCPPSQPAGQYTKVLDGVVAPPKKNTKQMFNPFWAGTRLGVFKYYVML